MDNNNFGWNEIITVDKDFAKYMGAININGIDYIIARIVNITDQEKDNVGNFIVREGIYAKNALLEGYGVLYIDQEKDVNAQILETYLNKNKDKIHSVEELIQNSEYVDYASDKIPELDKSSRIFSLELGHDEFLEKKLMLMTESNGFSR